jgi:hypothetical protein
VEVADAYLTLLAQSPAITARPHATAV